MQSKFVSSKNDGKNNRSTASQAASTLFIGNRLKADATEFQFAFSRSIGQMGKDDLYSLLTLSISNKDLFTIREVLDISRKKNFDLQNTVYLHGKPSSVFVRPALGKSGFPFQKAKETWLFGVSRWL